MPRSELTTAAMLLLAAMMLVHPVAAEAPGRLSASMTAALEQQAQLAVHPAGRLEMRSTSGTAGSRQEATADYAARLTDALVGGQPPPPHRTTAGTPATAAAPQPLPRQHASSGSSTLPAPLSHSEQLTAAAPASQYPTTTAATQLSRGYSAPQQLGPPTGPSPTAAAGLASEAMLRELVAEAAEAAAASAALALPPTLVTASGAANNTPPAPGTSWSAELIFDRNASSFGFSNR